WDVDEHTAIYEAVAKGDGDLAAARMREHILAIDRQYREVGA
ncbi:MAG: FCD domain-containing protein, partial [Actinobacteria bacterium]|nr:FCD domain-containing protein [Actinomycetota bacterium]